MALRVSGKARGGVASSVFSISRMVATANLNHYLRCRYAVHSCPGKYSDQALDYSANRLPHLNLRQEGKWGLWVVLRYCVAANSYTRVVVLTSLQGRHRCDQHSNGAIPDYGPLVQLRPCAIG